VSRAARAALAALMLSAGPALAAAQDVCAGQPIRSIRIRTIEVFSSEEPGPAPEWVADLAHAVNWRTDIAAVRADLLFREGDPCEPERLRETERLLRERANLRSATITVAAADDGGVDVEVTTRDDWTLAGSTSVRRQGARAVRRAHLADANLFGAGALGRLRFDNTGRRTGLAADFYVEGLAGWTSVGTTLALSLYRPFDAEVERTGWHVGGRYLEEPFGLSDDGLGGIVQPLLRSDFDVSGAWLFGRPEGPRAEFGVSLAASRTATFGRAQAGLPQDDSLAQALLAGRFAEVHRVSVSVIVGARTLHYEKRSGIEAVHAVQDVGLGIDTRVTVGRAIPVAGLRSDWFALGELYAGAALGRTLLFARARVEGLNAAPDETWSNLIAAGDAYAYVATGRRGTAVVGLEAAGGWRTTTPFQLTLGYPQGVRGFSGALPVGRRIVMQGEYRHYAGTVRHVADIGWAGFVDAGRGWAGNAPLARDIATLVSAGAGLRIAVPPGSQFVARLDAAVPLAGGHGVELRLSLQQQFGILHSEPNDVARSRQPPATRPPFNTLSY